MKLSSKIIREIDGNGQLLASPPRLPSWNGCEEEAVALCCADSSVRPFSWAALSSANPEMKLRSPQRKAQKEPEAKKTKTQEEIEEEARELSRQYIQEAQARATTIVEEAYREGFAQGEKDGREAGQKHAGPLLELLNRLLTELEPLRRQIWEQSETDLVGLSLAIAKRIVRREIDTDQEVVLRTAQEALESLVADDTIRIKVNPDDYASLMEARERLSLASEEPKSFTIETDGAISRGGCLVESSLGHIDARVEKQMEILESALKTSVRAAEGRR